MGDLAWSNKMTERGCLTCEGRDRAGALLNGCAERLVIALIIAACVMMAPARAQLRGAAEAPPQFSAADRAVIERNEMLRSIIEVEPALVRRVLDTLARTQDVQTPRDIRRETPRIAPRSPEPLLDRTKNPDLDRLERSSPEAMNDLFQLLKQASARRPRTQQ
jgi:uncharacterized membrane protein